MKYQVEVKEETKTETEAMMKSDEEKDGEIDLEARKDAENLQVAPDVQPLRINPNNTVQRFSHFNHDTLPLPIEFYQDAVLDLSIII